MTIGGLSLNGTISFAWLVVKIGTAENVFCLLNVMLIGLVDAIWVWMNLGCKFWCERGRCLFVDYYIIIDSVLLF